MSGPFVRGKEYITEQCVLLRIVGIKTKAWGPEVMFAIEPLMVLDEIPEKFLAEVRPAPPKGK
jgi:hypothetical protein